MKQTIVRLSVLALALSGFAASTVASHSQKNTTQVALFGGATTPTPFCPYNDPDNLGGSLGSALAKASLERLSRFWDFPHP